MTITLQSFTPLSHSVITNQAHLFNYPIFLSRSMFYSVLCFECEDFLQNIQNEIKAKIQHGQKFKAGIQRGILFGSLPLKLSTLYK